MENYAAIKARLLQPGAKRRHGGDRRRRPLHRAPSSPTASSARRKRRCRVSVGKALGRGVFAWTARSTTRTGGKRARGGAISPASRALARRAQLAECRLAYRRRVALGARPAGDRRGLASFPGLPHRMEEVGRIGKVRFINDSKATNADATAQALGCYPDIFWIAGGKPKEGGIDEPGRVLPAHPQGLSDRRGGAGVRRAPWTARCRMRSSARCRRRSTPPRATPQPSDAGAGGAAVAGLRLLRPVQGFRAARQAFADIVRAMPGVNAAQTVTRQLRRRDGVMSFARATHAASPIGGGRSTRSRLPPSAR